MDWLNQISGMLQQQAGSNSNETAGATFDTVAQHAPPNVLAGGLSEAFRSDQTPPFPQMLGQLFGNSNGTQQASVLNSLLGVLGPGAIGSLLGQGGGLAGLAGMLGQGGGQITPEQAQQISPEVIQQMATHAEQKDPGIIDQLSQMYANTPDIVKRLGAGALAVALAKIGKDHNLL
jgi:hypothetical protein